MNACIALGANFLLARKKSLCAQHSGFFFKKELKYFCLKVHHSVTLDCALTVIASVS